MLATFIIIVITTLNVWRNQASKLHCQKKDLEEAVKALLAGLNKQVREASKSFLTLVLGKYVANLWIIF